MQIKIPNRKVKTYFNMQNLKFLQYRFIVFKRLNQSKQINKKVHMNNEAL